LPYGWGSNWTADLPDISIIKVRSYPETLEQGPHSVESVTEDELKEVGQIWQALENNTHNSLNVAIRRLNLACLRSSEEDSILDLVIGLETLMVKDSGQGEISHKLSTRLATLVRLFPFEQYKPRAVFKICKTLYNYRSKVAHGDSKAHKLSKVLVPSYNKPIPIINVGLSFLRYAIRTLALNPKYLDPDEIDFALSQPEKDEGRQKGG